MVIINKKNTSVYFAVFLSIIFHSLGFTSFLLVLPLLTYYYRSRESKNTLLALVGLLVFILVVEIFPILGNLSDKGIVGMLSIGLFLPIALIGSSIVWVLLDGYRLLVRYVAGSAIIAVLMVIIGFWFKSDVSMAVAVDNTIFNLVNSLLSQNGQQSQLVLGAATQELLPILRVVVLSMLFPLGATCFGLNVFYALSTPKFFGDEEFDERVKNWKLPESFMWTFLASLILLLLNIVVDFTLIISLIVLNLVMFLALLFAVQGLSIILYRLRAKGKQIKAGKLFGLTLFLIILFQGLNIVAVFGLPIIGVTETWFTYRK